MDVGGLRPGPPWRPLSIMAKGLSLFEKLRTCTRLPTPLVSLGHSCGHSFPRGVPGMCWRCAEILIPLSPQECPGSLSCLGGISSTWQLPPLSPSVLYKDRFVCQEPSLKAQEGSGPNMILLTRFKWTPQKVPVTSPLPPEQCHLFYLHSLLLV